LGTSKPTDIERQNDHKDTWVIDRPALRADEEGKTVSMKGKLKSWRAKEQSEGSKSRSTKEARLPSVAPGGVLGVWLWFFS
jgi:hypothetical protein